MNGIAQFFRNRKLRKRYKEVRNTVRGVLASDDDILTPADKERFLALRRDVDSVKNTDAAGIEILEKKLDHILDRRSLPI